MVVSSVGGMSSAALGRVDFPSILNLDSDGEGLRQENDAKENDVELSDDLLVKRCDGVVSESHKVQFVLVQLVTGGCMVLLAVTARLELFFLLCVVAGLHRSCLYVVPFAAVNDVVQAKVTDSKKIGGKPQVGLGLSVVGLSMGADGSAAKEN
nr:hypothetical protein BaRGS_017843 [Batillaria attramentaria]